MSVNKPMRVGYVLKRYPRYSETFIVNEILAHESSGMPVEIFSLRESNDGHFQDSIARVRAFVNYIPYAGIKASVFWDAIQNASKVLPGLSNALEEARGEDASVRDVYQALLLAREIRLKDINHLHAHFATAATTVARLAASFAGVGYTLTAHAKDIFHESINDDDMKKKLNDAKLVVTISDSNLKYLQDTYRLDKTKIRRIYNGIDLNQFGYESPQERPNKIISVGRLIEKKGLSDLIQACKILAKHGHKFNCEIIGTGELKIELQSQIDSLGIGEMVKLTGPKPQSEVAKCVQSAAVFVAPCVIGSDGNRDGLPTVLLESMALGTPCISTNVNGIPEVLHHEKTGLMVAQNNPISLANEIERLYTDPTLRVNLATNARSMLESRFDIYLNASKLRDIFSEAVYGNAKMPMEALK
jgi:glycosyltransferase involved in cell wall biosynthesis